MKSKIRKKKKRKKVNKNRNPMIRSMEEDLINAIKQSGVEPNFFLIKRTIENARDMVMQGKRINFHKCVEEAIFDIAVHFFLNQIKKI